MNLDTLNEMDQAEFAQALADIFEHSPWIPALTWERKPFLTLDDLHQNLTKTVVEASETQQLALIRAHPDLAGKLAVAGELTDFSTAEQRSAQLDKLTSEQFEHMSAMNECYKLKFEFPFIICVKDHNQADIFEHFETRLNNGIKAERYAALKQIYRIAWHRLNDLIQ